MQKRLGKIHDVREELGRDPTAIASLTVIQGRRKVPAHVHSNPYLALHVLGSYRDGDEQGEAPQERHEPSARDRFDAGEHARQDCNVDDERERGLEQEKKKKAVRQSSKPAKWKKAEEREGDVWRDV